MKAVHITCRRTFSLFLETSCADRMFYICFKKRLFSQDMVNIVDKDGTGNIDFPEFLSMMAIKVLHSFSLETVSFSVQL